jgi:glutamate-1-semialdehyde 2,1-aminomutase
MEVWGNVATILERYEQLHPRSAALHAEALRFFPNGVTHDIRHLVPFPIYVERAAGSHKWDVDGHEIIDYVIGHGALLLGHAHPEVTRAVTEQLQKGTHYGACHQLEIRWAEWVQRLVPSAQVVRFTSSGTEATMMAVRLARAFTGRQKLVRFNGHFHGWNDSVVGFSLTAGATPQAVGIPLAALQNQVLVPQHDTEALRRALEEHNDVAAVIIEPTGASYGTLPLEPAFLSEIRDLTQRTGALLIFDEVVTGFRVAPGGAQALFGVLPDITCLAKVLAGGLTGGAVVGRREILSLLDFRDDEWNLKRRIPHPGTFNANPLSAAAGSACLSLIADGRPQEQAAGVCRRLCQGMNVIMRRAGVPGCAYGFSSMFHITMGHEVPPPEDDFLWRWEGRPGPTVPGMSRERVEALKRGMLNRGVDLMRNGGLVSAVHSEQDVEATLAAFEATLADMHREELI